MATQTQSSFVELPEDIEIFTAGDHITDAGIPITFTESDVADTAKQYDINLHESPITVGHPEHDKPAYGWVKRVYANDGRLMLKASQVEPQFAEMVRAGRFKKRSAAFYAPQSPNNPTPGHWYLRHVAFLGAMPPSVKGLKDVAFCDGDVCVSFTESINPSPSTSSKSKEPKMPDPTPTVPVPVPVPVQAPAVDTAQQARITELEKQNADLKAELEKAQADLKAAQDKLAAIEKAEEQKQTEQITQFAERMVKAGKILPKDRATEVAIMQDLAKVAPVQFSEGNITRTENKLQAYMKRLSGSDTAVQFGEFAPASLAVEQPKPVSTDEELDKKVKAYMATHSGTSYFDALKAVNAGGQ